MKKVNLNAIPWRERKSPEEKYHRKSSVDYYDGEE
jgi:hypothetical protein